MYQAETPTDQMSGPAVAKMALDYMYWDNTQDPTPPDLYDQSALYTEGLTYNEDPGLPYFDLAGMLGLIQTNKPGPYSEYGYNFIAQHNTDQSYMLGQICKWVCYDVVAAGVGQHPEHPTHVPSIIPAYGDYTNWMAIRGIHTDQDAYPMPGDLTIYGFWINDPMPGGIGENSYKTVTQLTDDYYWALSTGDSWDGEYAAVLEPPEGFEDTQITFAESVPRFNVIQTRVLGAIQSLDLVPDRLQMISNKWIIKAAIDGVTEELIPYDSGFEDVFSQVLPMDPFYVESTTEDSYYVVPFGVSSDVSVVVIIDASDGHFREASWDIDGHNYLPLSESDAKLIVQEFLQGITGFDQEYDFDMTLIHRGGSPYYPEFTTTYGQYKIFVDQEGNLEYIIIK